MDFQGLLLLLFQRGKGYRGGKLARDREERETALALDRAKLFSNITPPPPSPHGPTMETTAHV